VSAFVDTNVLIRHLTGDPSGPAARATRPLAEAETSGVNAVASFDKSIDRVPTVRRVEP
jgi:predicted nucleic acid-binding protein